MTSLRTSTKNELAFFDKMDRQDHASNFITQIGLKTHQSYFDDPGITYLSIENDGGELSGYFVLVVEPDNESLELRRILVVQNKCGIGQAAIKAVESYCRTKFGIKRIWLDVYEDNAVGRHVYEKLGFQQFKAESKEGRNILFYEKNL